jgi:hypothetical protein
MFHKIWILQQRGWELVRLFLNRLGALKDTFTGFEEEFLNLLLFDNSCLRLLLFFFRPLLDAFKLLYPPLFSSFCRINLKSLLFDELVGSLNEVSLPLLVW